jgi:hypothetical protein
MQSNCVIELDNIKYSSAISMTYRSNSNQIFHSVMDVCMLNRFVLGQSKNISKHSIIITKLGKFLQNTIGIVFFKASLSGHIIIGFSLTNSTSKHTTENTGNN